MQNLESRTLLAQKIPLVEPDADEHQATDQPQRPISSRVHFEDAPEQPEQLEPARGSLPQERKPKVYTLQSHSIIAPEIHDNSAALRIDSWDTLVAEVARDPDGVLPMILGMRSKDMQSLKQAKDSDIQPAILRGKSIALAIEQELELNRTERVKLLKQLVGVQIRVLRCESSGLLGQFDAIQNLIAQCEKKIESLQSILSANKDPPFSHIKKSTPQQPQPQPHSTTHALTAQANNRDEIRSLPLSKVPFSEDDSVAHTRQTMKIPDPLICKSKGDSDHYPSDSSKPIYARERLRGDSQPAILHGTSTALGIEQELELKQIERVKLLKYLVGAQIRLLHCESSGLLGQFDATQILLALCEEGIESLQSILSAKTDPPFSYVKKPTRQQAQPQPHSTHALTAEAIDQDEEKRIVIRRRPLSKAPLISEEDYSVSHHTRQTVKIPDPAIFTNGKDPTIDQWLLSMRARFEFDRDYYSSESNKLIYAKGRVGGKAQQHLEAYLHSNSLTSFSTIEDLFAHLQHIFGRSPYSKECSKGNKSRDLDEENNAVKDFYREFTLLAPHPPPPRPPRTSTSTSTNNVEEEQQQQQQHTYETSIMEFMDKIGPVLRKRLNSPSNTELPENIKYFGKRCLDIFDEMKATGTVDDS